MSFLNEKNRAAVTTERQVSSIQFYPTRGHRQNFSFRQWRNNNSIGRLIITVESGDWKIQAAPFFIVVDQKANIIGRNILQQKGIKLIQEKTKTKQRAAYTRIGRIGLGYQTMGQRYFQQLCIRIRKSKNLVMKTQLSKDVSPIQQKNHRIPVQLQERVEAEL